MHNTITTFEDFTTSVIDGIRDYLPEEYQDANIKAETINKPAGSYTGMTARRKDNPIAAAANLDQFYEDYTDGLMDFEGVMESIARVLQTTPPKNNGMDIAEWIRDYNQVKERLFIQLVNAESRRDFLESAPHIKVTDDLAIIFRILVNQDGNGMASTPIDNTLLGLWEDVAEGDLYNDALGNAPKILPAKIATLWGTVMEMGFVEEEDPMGDDSPLVVSNTTGTNGAAVIFYPGIAERIAERMGGTFCILPSSIHEVLIVPDDGNYTALAEMVRDINRNVVDPAEVLSDNIYRYDGTEIVRV